MPTVDVVITHLELARAGFRPKRSSRPGVSFSHADPAVPELNRFFYAAVGGQWYWLDRRLWTLRQWELHLADGARIETWVLAVDGVPAGYAELERRGAGVVEVAYLGLLRQFIGCGLGAHLVSSACARAFELGALTVLLNTCSLDHPQALANYQARGFKPVRTEAKRRDLPPNPPGPWDGAV